MAPHHDRRPFWHLRRTPRSVREEVDEEIRIHVEMRVDELLAQGLSEEDARREALRRFGDVESTRRYFRRQAAPSCSHQPGTKQTTGRRRYYLV